MPLGAGQNIGTAFVRVVVDGKDFDLSELFDDADSEMGKAGARNSKTYREEWIKEWQSGPSKKEFARAIQSALADGDSAKAYINSTDFKEFRERLERQYGEIGRRAGDNFTNDLLNGMKISEVKGRVEELNRELRAAEAQLNAEAQRDREDQFRLHLDTIAAYREQDLRNQRQVAMVAAALREDEYRDLQRTIMLDQAYRMNKEFDIRKEIELQNELAFLTRAFRINEEMDTKAVIKANSELQATYARLRVEVDAMEKGYRRSSLTATDLREKLDAVAESMEKADLMTDQMRHDIDRHRDALLVLNPELNIWRHRLNGVADGLGRAFGKGARNDFVNFMGVVVGGVFRILPALLAVGAYVNGFKNRVMDASGWLGGLGVVGREAAKGLAVLGGGMVGLYAVIGPLISILSGLGGMVLAVASSMGAALLGAISSLSSTLVFGLAGAVGVAALSFAPLVAGIGVFALAVKNADADTKAAFKSIGKEFAGLGKVAADATFGNIAEQATRFKGVIGDLSPLVRGVGKALSNVADGWLDLMEGPGFAKFQQAMTEFLPGAVEQLGAAVGNVAAGIGGLFRALIPQTEVFLGWLVDITARFRDFANSANGQTSLRNFFADAASSAATLGSFIAAVGSLLGEVFEQANAPGDNLFRSMTQGLLDWADALDRNPDIMGGWIKSMESFGEFTGSVRDLLLELVTAGKGVGDSLFGSMSAQIDKWVQSIRSNPDILRNWYSSAADFARVLGDVVIGFGKIADALDNEFSRNLLVSVFDGLATIIDGVATALSAVAEAAGLADGTLGKVAGSALAASFAFGKISAAITGMGITAFVANMKDAEKRTSTLAATAKKAAGIGGVLALATGIADASNEGTNFTNVLSGMAGGAGIGMMFGPLGALIGGAAGGGLVALTGAFKETAAEAVEARKVMMQDEGFANAKAGAETLTEALGGVVTAYGNVSRAAVEASFWKDGKLQADVQLLRDLGVSMDTITSAALGQADAQKIVNDALTQGTTDAEAFYESRKKTFEEMERLYGSNSEAAANAEQDMLDAKKALDDFNVAQQTFGERVDANGDAIVSWREKVMAVRDALGLTREEYKQIPREVRTEWVNEGLTQTSKDSLRLIGQYEELQSFKTIRSIVKADGAELSWKQIKDLTKAYELTPKQVKTLVREDGSLDAKLKFEAARKAAQELGKQEPRPKVSVDPSLFDKGMKDVNNALDTVGKVTKTPKVNVDTGNSIASANAVEQAIANIKDKTVTVTTIFTERRGAKEDASPTASGGIFYGPERRLIGEAGAEAVVPLARNLSMVDPSVRWLSAIAQGKSDYLATAAGKSVSADNWTIVSQSRDPETVAAEVFNRLVGAGY